MPSSTPKTPLFFLNNVTVPHPPSPVKHLNKQQLEEKQTNKQTDNNNKNKPSTVVPELVTLDCSLTHVLQAPNTQPYHYASKIISCIFKK